LPIANFLTPFVSILLILFLVTGVASASRTTKAKAKHPAQLSNTRVSSRHHSSKHGVKTASKRSRGQRGIDEERTRDIQTALIREHYMSGEPSGTWDQSTRDAMTRFQAANGWQTKITPDSRALIKLGLGPDHKGLLNPETAVIPAPHELGVAPEAQPGGAANQE
jgi:peptidoglycan hydrolase-like protein with peptidoglycan-binding domain